MVFTRPRVSVDQRSEVVYEFTCNKPGCNSSYFWFTTCCQGIRVTQHRSRSSSTYPHYTVDHDVLPSKYNCLLNLFEVVHSNPVTISLKVAKSISTAEPYITRSTVPLLTVFCEASFARERHKPPFSNWVWYALDMLTQIKSTDLIEFIFQQLQRLNFQPVTAFLRQGHILLCKASSNLTSRVRYRCNKHFKPYISVKFNELHDILAP